MKLETQVEKLLYSKTAGATFVSSGITAVVLKSQPTPERLRTLVPWSETVPVKASCSFVIVLFVLVYFIARQGSIIWIEVVECCDQNVLEVSRHRHPK